MKIRKNRLLSLPFAAGCILILGFALVFYLLGSQKPVFLSGLDNKIMDVMFRIRGPVPHSGQVIIVDIDEKSLKMAGQWPWPRDIMADLIRSIQDSGARVVGFDMVFPEPDRTSPSRQLLDLKPVLRPYLSNKIFNQILENPGLDHDLIFGDALSRGRVVLGYAFQLREDNLKAVSQVPFPSARIRLVPESASFERLALIPAYRALVNVEALATAETEGFLNVLPDDSGTVRKVPLLMKMDGIPYPSLALETWRLGTGNSELVIHTDSRIKTSMTPVLGVGAGNTFIPTGNSGQVLVNHRGPVNTFEYIPAWDLLDGKIHPGLKDKFVLVGSSATGLFDLKATPFSSSIPGVEINATVIDNLLKGDPFEYDVFTEIAMTYTLILVGGILLNLVLCFSTPLLSGLGALVFFISMFTGNYYYYFLENDQVGMSFPFLIFLVILFTVSILNYVREGRAKQYIQRAFSHYVAPGVVKGLLKNPDRLSLSGELKELTVLFSDIRGFTGMAEKMDPQVLGTFMNLYLTRMSRIIMANKGTVDKFIGDAIMAFWGAPGEDPDHSAGAVHTALLMQEHLREINRDLKDLGIPDISIGIGINTGPVSVGNFGSRDRFDYTVMGDNVNLASRLEGINKEYGTTILVSESVTQKLSGRFSFRYVDRVRVKGRKESVRIYEPGLSEVIE
ncbi:CHASE2 domain-containing protein [Desulfospira joergensenii]|uniref:CHASE2 domain-containing protein n=1 Tax=Desulfospira joergensenii TaxID=53329 RepID=UPI0003B5CC6D|nr:adenylate/guanylate cyclase domain-containing protein [Desulfospira joergensenii]